VRRIGPKAKDTVPFLVPLLDHKDIAIRIGAMTTLSMMGPDAKPGVPRIAELLKSDDKRLRYQATEALKQLGPSAAPALPRLIECLPDLQPPISPHPILVMIGNIGPEAKEAVPALIDLLKKPRDNLLAADVVETLGRIGPSAKAAAPHLVAFLDNDSPHSRARAARALGQMGPMAEEAVPALKKAWEDESKMVRVWAGFALAQITQDRKTYLPRLIEWWKRDKEDGFAVGSIRYEIAQAWELLGVEARPARDLLLEALLDPKTLPGTRSHLARALGQLGDEADVIVPQLAASLERPLEGFIRTDTYRDVLEALTLLGPKAKAAAPAIRRLLDDDEDQIADAAARALDKIEVK
jgi:HEAT repeat protein